LADLDKGGLMRKERKREVENGRVSKLRGVGGDIDI